MIGRLLKFWVILIALTGAIASWFAIQAIVESCKFVRLNEKVPAQIVKWDIKMLSSSRYALATTYRYTVDSKEFTGYTVFTSLCYPNYYAAESDLKTYSGRSFWAWHQRNYPPYSSLQKIFPKKECTNALLTLGVFLYFFLLRGVFSHKLKEDSSL
ncbi:MAG TPA: hypothetical protein VGJ00_01820 [Rhabdochlamydiaceae bacterium]|jgi:hypothetical protein